MNLSESIKQRYRTDTAGKSPTEINQELRKRGVKGFVVNVNHNRVTMLVDRRDIKQNKECMR
ncbi:hypothetical protein [Staphylococcus pseudintermedius]|uniref:hypothetical protein n=1 Tax=Staphylococcus pseudintermedius TaxID=283734 RepID=UPI00286E8E59|nr:hypothetical protein [Staphylococcus pseudintermedius]WMZ46848.1 hypothetical protein QS415_09055 [Staphylococcus pseudintermedius]